MNPKLKDILHNAWTEPRHFFLWLSLFSLCGFVVIATGAGFHSSNVALALIALVCALWFVVSVGALVLTLVPPVRRLLAWLLARRFLVLAALVTLVALFYAVENWRGRRAWLAFKTSREVQGQRFDFASLAGLPVSTEKNFF